MLSKLPQIFDTITGNNRQVTTTHLIIPGRPWIDNMAYILKHHCAMSTPIRKRPQLMIWDDIEENTQKSTEIDI